MTPSRFPRRCTLALLVLLGGAPGSAAFQFDVWRSGVAEARALELARDQGVTLSKGSLLNGWFGKGDPRPTDGPPDLVEHEGRTKLLGYEATLRFEFTPDTRLLHTLEVKLSVPRSGKEVDVEVLANTIARQLEKRYKEVDAPGDGGLLGSLADRARGTTRRAWGDGRDLVVMEHSWGLTGGRVVVTYRDEKLVEQGRAEDVRLREERLEKTGGGDKGKF